MRRDTAVKVLAQATMMVGAALLVGCGVGETAAVNTTVPAGAWTSVLNATTAPTAPSTTTTEPSTTTTEPSTTTTEPPTTTTTSTTVVTEPTEPPIWADLTLTVSDPFAGENTFHVVCPGEQEKACARLGNDVVQNRLIEGAPRDRMCSMIFGSGHRATVTGMLNGSVVDTGFARNDGCAIGEWDDLMAGILPAVGV